jgi:hypothetical protein
MWDCLPLYLSQASSLLPAGDPVMHILSEWRGGIRVPRQDQTHDHPYQQPYPQAHPTGGFQPKREYPDD